MCLHICHVIEAHLLKPCGEQVLLKYEDDCPVDGKGVGRKVIDKMKQTYDSELANKDFAYDGEKTLFTLGPLPLVKNEFVVVLEAFPSGRFVQLLFMHNHTVSYPHRLDVLLYFLMVH
jgi:N-terminal domain of argonaute